MTPNTVSAETYWVWTDLAQDKNPKHSREGKRYGLPNTLGKYDKISIGYTRKYRNRM